MAQPFAHRAQIDVCRDHKAGAGMSKSMDIDIGKPVALEKLIEPPGKGIRVHGLSFPRGEQPPAVLPAVTGQQPLFRLPYPVGPERFEQAGRYLYRAL